MKILEYRPSWCQDCRMMEVNAKFPVRDGGIIELIYTQVSKKFRNIQISLIFRKIIVVKNIYICLSWSCNKHWYFRFDVQFYAPTTLAPARDFWTLKYTSTLEDGSLVVSSDFQSLLLLWKPNLMWLNVFTMSR